MSKEKRTCFVILEGQRDENGYIPSNVTENEAGHSPMTGRGEGAQPWYWGKTYEEAQKICDKVNAERGITPLEAMKIVASSMRFTFSDT